MKNKILLLCSLIYLFSLRLFAQNNSDSLPMISDIHDSVKHYYYVDKCADSLNLIKSGIIPYWIADPCFDFNQNYIVQPSHHNISLRFEIICKIEDIDLLNYLLNLQHNEWLNIVCDKRKLNAKILFSNYSTYELLSFRLEQIKQFKITH